jgi:hypothetical protein
MKKSLLTLFILFLALACAPKESPQDTSSPAKDSGVEYASQTTFEPGKGVLIEQSAKITATVVAVDRADRSITIKDPDGKIHEIELTDDVKNFAQINPGDKIVTEVYSGLFMALAEPGEEFAEKSGSQVAVAEPGQKPMIVNVDMVETLAKITAINRETREVTVTGPRGNSITLQVPENIERFDEIRVGDKVNARYVEAFAIAVEELN